MTTITSDRRNQLIGILVNEIPVLRARLGASQEDVAKRIGVSRQTYNAFETQKKPINWTVFVALVALFDSDPRTKQMLDSITEFKDSIESEMGF